MADQEQEDRTEQASERRLEQARREGTVPIGRDVATVASLVAVGVLLVALGPSLRAALVRMVATAAASVANGRPLGLMPLVGRTALLGAAAPIAAAVAAIAAIAVQTRGGFWIDLALPSGDRLFGAGRLARLFRREALADLGLAAVKNLALGWTLWLTLRDESLTLVRLLEADPAVQLAALFEPFSRGAVRILAALVAISGADLALTRRRNAKRMRMTREELKRELRDDEGDPRFRARRRRRHRDLIKNLVRVEVPRADVLIVNPTHVAVALRYRADADQAPRVTAKGKGAAAEAMRELAREHGVPIVEDVPLARLLFKRVKVGRFVPVETYKAVAAVLAFVYRVLGHTRRQEAGRP